jgi:hypothetical protein
MTDQYPLQLFDIAKLFRRRKFAHWIHLWPHLESKGLAIFANPFDRIALFAKAPILRSPSTHDIKTLQGKSNRIYLGMATSTTGIGTM